MCDKEKAMDKIRKLLALGTSPSESEASNAMTKAREIALQYELDIDMLDDESGIDIIVEAITDNRPGVAKWEQSLIGGIGEALSCKTIIGKKPHGRTTYRYRLSIVGFSADVEVCKYLYAYLKETVVKLANQEMKGYDGPSGRPRESYRESYLYGVVDSVVYKVKTKFVEMEDNANITALVHRKDMAVQNYMDNELNVGKGGVSGFSLNGEANSKGKADGQKVSIHRGVEKGTNIRQQSLLGA